MAYHSTAVPVPSENIHKVRDYILNSRLKYTYRTKQFKEMPFKK